MSKYALVRYVIPNNVHLDNVMNYIRNNPGVNCEIVDSGENPAPKIEGEFTMQVKYKCHPEDVTEVLRDATIKIQDTMFVIGSEITK